MVPDWDNFRILLALGRGGSVAAASRELGIDHSTVSRRLAALEDSLGARLIVRGGREFAWTAEGRAAMTCAETMEAAISNATRAIRTTKLEAEGTVRVSCASGLVPFLMRMVPAVHEKHPLLQIELLGDNTIVNLSKGEADIAVRMTRPAEPDLIARRAFECGWDAYASKAYVAAHGLPASIDELSNHRLVLYVEALHRVAPMHWMEDHRGAATQITQVDSVELSTELVSLGSVIGVIPCFFADARSEMVRVFPEPVTFNTGWIVYHETARDTARVHTVVEALVEFFESHVALFSGHIEGGADGPPRCD